MSKPNMKAALQQVAGSRMARSAPQEPQEAVSVSEATNPPAVQRKPSRAQKSHIGGYFAPDVHQQLKIIAAEQGKTVQQLMGEALNYLFSQYGKAEIAPTTRD